MLYRQLGQRGCEVSILGFGCMRLPMVDSFSAADIFDPNVAIDEEEATGMIRYAIESGVNYFDTAYPYHGGQSERFLGKALKADRDRVMIATKMPTWLIQDDSDFERYFDEQLERLDTDYIDFYLLHGLSRPLWPRMKEVGALKFLDRVLADNRVRYAGFSFHDDIKIFKEIVDGYDWTLCQIQYNYYDENFQAGREGLEYAAARGLGVVAMEPLRGGKLTDKIPGEVQAIWDSAGSRRSPAEWALRWVWNHPGVSTVLSGMSSLSQVIENITTADEAAPYSLSGKELDVIRRVTETYQAMQQVNCTYCSYCMPCPQGVNIPLNFSLYNDTFFFKDPEMSLMLYNHMIPPEQRATNCNECGECEEACTQQIKIIEEMKKVHKKLAR